MFGERTKLKYEAVEGQDEETIDQDVDFMETRRNFINSNCLWTSLFTSFLIGTYYIPSICLTFYQRWFYQTFHFPLSTVLVHMLVKFLLACLIRAVIARKYGNKQRISLGWKDYIFAVSPMGIFSGLDIGLSNWGLELIQVSLYTMTKSTTIVFILFFSILFKLEKKSWSLVFIVVMITVGLILFTYKATNFHVLGFSLLLLASFSSGIRWTCMQLLLQKSKMGMKNPLDMIYHMQPWMILSLLPFAMWIEGPTVIRNWELFRSSETSVVVAILAKILLGAFIAFFMEVCEVMVVTYTSSLTLSIAGIVKEVFILFLAVELNGDRMSAINVVGLLVCLSGITLHVGHKLSSTNNKTIGKIYEDERKEFGEHLMDDISNYDESSESDSKSDTQVLFDILNKRER